MKVILMGRSLMAFEEGNEKFKVGRLVATKGVADFASENNAFNKFVGESLSKHTQGDWGDVSKDDKAQNDEALRAGKGNLDSKYVFDENISIFIITEWDRSATTILFPHEY